MQNLFNCPACSQTLNFDGKTNQICGHCGANIIVPAHVFHNAAQAGQSPVSEHRDILPTGQWQTVKPKNETGVIDQIRMLSDLSKLIKDKQKVHAVKMFRDHAGCTLKEAYEVIQQLETGNTSLFVERFEANTYSSSSDLHRTQKKGSFIARVVPILVLIAFILLALVGFLAGSLY